MSKASRTLSLLNRSTACSRLFIPNRPHLRFRHSLASQNGLVKVQPVRFRKPTVWRRMRRFAMKAGIATITVVGVLWYLGALEDEEEEGHETDDKAKTHIHISIEFKNGEKAEGEEGEGDEGGVDIPEVMPEDAIFIPLGLTRQRPQEFYKGSDPEWQSFLEFRRDRDREKAVRSNQSLIANWRFRQADWDVEELAVLVGRYFSGMPSVQKGLGTPIKVRHFWMDVIIPEGPPPEYERSGLEIADDYIAWTKRPVSALQRNRFQSVLLPLPIAKSIWASFSTALSLQLAMIKQYLKLDGESKDRQSSLPPGMTSMDQLDDSSAKEDSQAPNRMDKLSDPESTGDGNTKANSKQASEGSKILSLLPTVPLSTNANGAAITAFKQTLARNWNPASDFGERGTLLVSGLVLVEGPKGACVLDVAAAYHPRESRYTHITCGIRNFRPRYQRPRGGP